MAKIGRAVLIKKSFVFCCMIVPSRKGMVFEWNHQTQGDQREPITSTTSEAEAPSGCRTYGSLNLSKTVPSACCTLTVYKRGAFYPREKQSPSLRVFQQRHDGIDLVHWQKPDRAKWQIDC